MDIRAHLLHCVGEECGEIQQVIGKAGRFGLFDMNPHTKHTNWFELDKEIHDLIAVYEMLFEREVGVPFIPVREKIEAKKARVLHYMDYARQVGQLKEGAPK